MPLSFSRAGAWPAGLAVSATDGSIAGKPTQAGSYPNLSITVKDDDGETATLGPFTIAIAAAAVTGGSLDFSDPNNSNLIL